MISEPTPCSLTFEELNPIDWVYKSSPVIDKLKEILRRIENEKDA